MHTWACPGLTEWTSSGWFNGTWTSRLWQCGCVTSCISFFERPRWKKQLYEWCKMTSRTEQHDCLKGCWEGLDQRGWIRMTRWITWWKPAYAFMHLWSIYVTKTQTTREGQGDRWRNVGVVQQCKSCPPKPDQCQWPCFFSLLIFFFLIFIYKDGITPERMIVSIRVQSAWCLSCRTSWQDKWHHCKWGLDEK